MKAIKITKNKSNLILLLIVVLSAFLRLLWITNNPPSLNWDEVSHGYNAYSILKTGKDEWGVAFPTIFKAYGDYKLPVYIYLTSLSVAIFGLNAFAVRLPSVLAGVSMVIFTYFLTLELFRNKNRSPITRPQRLSAALAAAADHRSLALFAALLVAIEPWSLFLSRGAFEANVAQAFIVAGVYFFVRVVRHPELVSGSDLKQIPDRVRNDKGLLLSMMLLGLSTWTYNSARIFVPIFSLVMAVLFKDELTKIWKEKKIHTAFCLLLATIFFLPMFYQLVNPAGQARYSKVAIIDDGAIGRIIEMRDSSDLSPMSSRLIYNRPTYFAVQFVKNYISHYSGKFLFFEGGSHYQFSVPNHGLLYTINFIFLLVGVFFLIKKRKKSHLLLLSWFYLAPVASSLTREAPHVLRSITFLPTPMIISAVGLSWLLEKLKNKKIQTLTTILYSIVVLLLFVNYLFKYFNEYKKKYSWSWQYGCKQVVNYVKDNYDRFDKIIVTKKYGEPHEFFLFHWPWDPESFRGDTNLIRFDQSNWYWVDRFDKFYFVNDWDIPEEEWENFALESGGEFNCESQRCLLITSPDNYPKGWNKFETINFLDDMPAFEIFEGT